jgi:hypothetical protein
VCRPSSLEINSLENVNPGNRDRFLSQKIAQKDPEKKMPYTAAKATNLSWKVLSLFIHFIAHCAFYLTTSIFVIAENRKILSFTSLI